MKEVKQKLLTTEEFRKIDANLQAQMPNEHTWWQNGFLFKREGSEFFAMVKHENEEKWLPITQEQLQELLAQP